MSKLYIIFIAILLLSCNKNDDQKGQVDLEIIDKEVYFSRASFRNNLVSKKNVITYKLINRTSKKLYFILNDDDIYSTLTFNEADFIDPLFFGRKGKLLFNIVSKNKKRPEESTFILDNFSKGNVDCLYYIQKRNELKNKISELEVPVFEGDYNLSNAIRKNSFVLYPNQSKYFKTVLYLPKKTDTLDNSISEIKFNSKEDYSFNLVYMLDKKLVMKVMPDYKLKELKENDIEIFNGTLESNKVQLKVVQ